MVERIQLRKVGVAAARGGNWWARQDSNLQPDGYEPPALTIELRARAGAALQNWRRGGGEARLYNRFAPGFAPTLFLTAN